MERTITENTSQFIQALEGLLKVEESLLSGFSSLYGDEVADSMFNQSGLWELTDNLKSGIKSQIGTSIEISLGESRYKSI